MRRRESIRVLIQKALRQIFKKNEKLKVEEKDKNSLNFWDEDVTMKKKLVIKKLLTF